MGTRRPFIAVETDLAKDERPAVIADCCGYNVFEARGRLITLWSWCADRRLKDAPDDCDGYAVPEAVVRRFLGPEGVRGILGDGCDALALGELRADGLICLRGTGATVASFRAMLSSAAAGGRARADSSRDDGGRFVRAATEEVSRSADSGSAGSVAEHTNSPAVHQPSASRAPAGTTVDPRSQIPDPGSDLHAHLGRDLVDAPPARKPTLASRSARSVRMPEQWAPRSDELALAKTLGVDASRELAAFRDHHGARGTRFVDWNAAFRTWLRNAVKFSRGGPRTPGPSFFEVLDSLPLPHRGQA